MAEDASGNDGEGGRREPPAAPDGQHSDGDTESAWPAGDRDTTASSGRDDRLEGDGRASGTDRIGRRERTDDEYRVPLDLSGASDEDETDANDAGEDDPYAPEPSSTPIEPGDPTIENVLFVILGAVAMVLVMFQLASITF